MLEEPTNSGSEPPIDPATIFPTDPQKGGEGGKREPVAPPSPPLSPPVREIVSVPVVEFVAQGVFTPAPRTNPVIDALQERGHYQQDLGDHRHNIQCP